MKIKNYLLMAMILALVPGLSPSAQVIRPEGTQMCGTAIQTDQVMVLDLRSFGGRDIGGQRAFVRKHAGNYVPAHENLYIVLVPQAISTMGDDAPLRQSQIEAAKQGCDLVLVYRSEIRSPTQSNGWIASADVQFATRSR